LPTRLLLDGPDIETVLTRVQEEHGPAARIVRAERVRSGGLAGFFAKERYEVSVEVDPTVDDAPHLEGTPARALAGRERPTLHEAAYDDTAPHDTARALPTLHEATYDDSAWVDDELPPALRIAQEMDGIIAEPVAAQASTAGSAFADVLGRVTGSLDPTGPSDPTDPAVPVTHVGTVAPLPDGDSFVPSPPRPVVRPGGRHAVDAAAARPTALALIHGPLVALPPPAPAPAPAPDPPRVTHRPARPPCTPGAVLVLVGDARVGTRAARDLARTLGIDPGGILLAATSPQPGLVAEEHRLLTPPEARVAAGRLMMGDQPGIVVVDHPIAGDTGWTNAVLDALGATAIWAVVDATRKADDLARWVSGLLRVDALVVHNVAATEDLGCITALGRPLALLDAQPATGPAWHSLDYYRDR
jgi:hypothetical protein